VTSQDQLGAAGHEITDRRWPGQCWRGCRREYDTVVTVPETTTETDMKPDDILPKLRQVESGNTSLSGRMRRPSSPGPLAVPSPAAAAGGTPGGRHNHGGNNSAGSRGGAAGRRGRGGSAGDCSYCGKQATGSGVPEEDAGRGRGGTALRWRAGGAA
jgi:hypothetical protein